MEIFRTFWTLFILHFTHCLASEGDSTLHKVLHEIEGDDVLSDQLVYENDELFVGGADHILQLALFSNLPDKANKVDFLGIKSNVDACKQFMAESDCNNVVKVLQRLSSAKLLVCGSNAGEPKCYHFLKSSSKFTEVDLGEKTWMKEASPAATVMYATTDAIASGASSSSEEIYIGGANGMLYRKSSVPLDASEGKWLKDAEFNAILHVTGKKFIYILFNEKSSNFVGENFADSPKEDYYGMVARVCQNDKGGTWKDKTFMTFNKVRLVVPWPGDSSTDEGNMLYNELVAVDQTDSDFIGLFRPHRNWNLKAYAVAIYNTDDIDGIISGTDYLCEPESSGKATTEKFSSTSADPFKPGMCAVSASYQLRSDFEKFALRCSLVKTAALPVGGKAILTFGSKVEFKFIFARKTSVATAIFLLSESGFLKKIVHHSDGTTAEIFEKQMLPDDETLLAAKLIEDKGYIVANTAKKIVTFPLFLCKMSTDCHSCNGDPNCEWKADLNNFKFECVDASSASRRTCSATPEKAKNLKANLEEAQLTVSWELDRSPGTVCLVAIVASMTKEVALSQQPRQNSIVVQRSVLQNGRVYDVIAAAVKGTTKSKEIKTSFTTVMQSPVLKLAAVNGILSIGWSEVPSAASYHIEIKDSADKTLQGVFYQATTENLVFHYHGVEEGQAFVVNAVAVSEDDIRSEMTTGRLTAGPQEEVVDRPDVSVEPVVQSFGIQSGGPGAAGGSCTIYIIGMAAAASLFGVSFLMIFHNLSTITPGVNLLKDPKGGCSYQRQFLIIWSKMAEVNAPRRGDASRSKIRV